MSRPHIGIVCPVLSLLFACTTPIPEDPNNPSSATEQLEERVSAHDRAALTKPGGLLVKLAQDASVLDRWEQSDGWVLFYQGKLAQSIEAFGEVTPANALGVARAHLELAESYDNFARATIKVTKEWLKLERQSPHAKLYKHWLDWTELTLLTLQQSERAQELVARLNTHPEMAQWAKVAVESNPDHVPPNASRAYRLWLEFAQKVSTAKAGEAGALQSARKRARRLMKRQGRALIAPLLTTQPDPKQPEHKVFDIRLASTHRDYHALEALDALSKASSPWAKKLEASAYLLLGQHQRAIGLLTQLLTPEGAQEPPSDDFLLLTAHLSRDDVLNESRALLAGAYCATAQEALAAPLVKRLWSDNPTTITTTIWSLKAAASCPKVSTETAKMTDAQRKLFPRLRRPLEQAVFDEVKGPAVNRVASLGITERWLDELQYQYAWSMSLIDERVPALNALSSAEDSRAPMRLGGRNRLHRLALSATHQINLRRLRVASKYFLRLREQLPAVAALAEMTSDVLSGTSFSATGQVNAGQ